MLDRPLPEPQVGEKGGTNLAKMVDMTKSHDQYSHVKVKSAELKAKLPLYLRKLRETGEPIEVLLHQRVIGHRAVGFDVHDLRQ